MKKLNAMELEKLAVQFDRSVEKLTAKKKSLQSMKTNLNKKKRIMTEEEYLKKLDELVVNIDALNQTIRYLQPRDKFVTEYVQADVDILDFDQTAKAILSIQSAICRCQHDTADINDNLKYQSYKKIEEMLQEHKKTVKPVEDSYIRKSDLIKIIDMIKSSTDTDIDHVIIQLEELLK